MKKTTIALAIALALVCTTLTAFAQPIRYSLDRLSGTGRNLVDEESVEFDTDAFQLLGVNLKGEYIIYADDQYLAVDDALLRDTVAALGLEKAELPLLDTMEPMARNSRGDAVAAFQTALRTLGFLNGYADGSYGGQSETAVSAFQESIGEEPTGEASPLLQLLVLSMAAEEQVITESLDPTVRWAFLDDGTLDLAPLYDSSLKLDYDDIAGTGLITDGSVIEHEVETSYDIDRNAMTVRFGLYFTQEKGGVQMQPVVLIDSVCVRRPMMNSLILKAGNSRATVEIQDLGSTLSGAQSVEHGMAVLDKAAVETLIGAVEADELKLRVNCQYTTMDISVPQESIAVIAEVGTVAQAMLPLADAEADAE